MSALEAEDVTSLDLAAPVPAGDRRRVVGTSDELERIDSDTLVSGGLLAGVCLSPGVRVEVHGLVRGPVHLGPDAVLHVVGEYAGDRFGDDGLVVVVGRCALRAATRPGVGLASGTVLVDARGGTWLLDDAGHPVLVRPGRALAPCPADPQLMAWSSEHDRFVPA